MQSWHREREKHCKGEFHHMRCEVSFCFMPVNIIVCIFALVTNEYMYYNYAYIYDVVKVGLKLLLEIEELKVRCKRNLLRLMYFHY